MLERSRSSRSDIYLSTLEKLLAIEALELEPALTEAAGSLAEVFQADKIDVFLHDEAADEIVALGVSHTPMGRHQIALRLNHLPISQGGRAVEVFTTGRCYIHGQVDQDPGELRGVRQDLGVRSQIACPLTIAGRRRGVLQACSAQPEWYDDDDLRFLELVARWIGLVAHRAELLKNHMIQVQESVRREAAKDIIKGLTPRQLTVARLIALGYSNSEIAREIVITQGTAANHVRALLQRLNVPSRARIAALVTAADLSPDGTNPDGQSSV